MAAELAENYLWQIKWMNERFDMQHYGADEGEGVLKMAEVAGMLRRQEVPLVILDTVQTGRVPVIQEAIKAQYELLGEMRSRHVPLELYVPRR